MFNTTNFPGASATNLAAARGALCNPGRARDCNLGFGCLSEKNNQYTYLGENVQRGRQREFALLPRMRGA
ncbi:MAG: hypothetical protein IPJ07_25500 [Acidobacteria bacterium]|nr:hypothetical protein [Acidobacteriota bacterium]